MDYKETIWVTGCKGFLGREIVKRLKATYNCTVVGTDKELMVTDPERIDAFAQDLRPDVVINCAGISRAVTGLSNRIHAYEVNALGARNVALAANNVGALMVQISTDDVFPVRMAEPANEFDTPHPETPYGKSKRAGEVMVCATPRPITLSFALPGYTASTADRLRTHLTLQLPAKPLLHAPISLLRQPLFPLMLTS